MGFDVNFNNKPIIQGAKSTQDGGAGNLGYFEREEKDEKEKSKNESIFSEQGSDTFKKSDDLDLPLDDFSIPKLIAQIIMALKVWFRKIFRLI